MLTGLSKFQVCTRWFGDLNELKKVKHAKMPVRSSHICTFLLFSNRCPDVNLNDSELLHINQLHVKMWTCGVSVTFTQNIHLCSIVHFQTWPCTFVPILGWTHIICGFVKILNAAAILDFLFNSCKFELFPHTAPSNIVCRWRHVLIS